jgi:hypothetical protein
MKWPYFDNRSTATKIINFPPKLCNPSIKSIEISSQILVGMCSCCNSPLGVRLSTLWHWDTSHSLINCFYPDLQTPPIKSWLYVLKSFMIPLMKSFINLFYNGRNESWILSKENVIFIEQNLRSSLYCHSPNASPSFTFWTSSWSSTLLSTSSFITSTQFKIYGAWQSHEHPVMLLLNTC